MKTETHYKYALLLCDRYFASASPVRRAEFTAGCVAPDIDPFSYLRGFSTRPFFGHNWENAKGYILSAARQQESGNGGFFKLGLLMHYLCDAFTLPHNQAFTGSLREHSRYEKRLHACVLLSGSRDDPFAEIQFENLADFIENAHRRYEMSARSVETDAKFIISVAERTAYCLSMKAHIAQPAGFRCAERYTSRP